MVRPVPSFQHELFVELFRNRPELVRELLRACVGIELAGTATELGPSDLSQLAPAQYLADCVAIVRDGPRATAAAVVEIQLSTDSDKRFSWPVYVASLRAQLHCPVFLLVLAPDDHVARWAREDIALGHPGFQLAPIVIACADVPRITDPTVALAAPELAVLSVLGHPELDVAHAALTAIAQLPAPRQELYFDVVLGTLPDPVKEAIEARMLKYEYQSDFARKYFAQGLEQGRTQGMERGAEQGTENGLQLAAIGLARLRLGPLDAADEARIRGVHGVAPLLELVAALGRASDEAGARAVLDGLGDAG